MRSLPIIAGVSVLAIAAGGALVLPRLFTAPTPVAERTAPEMVRLEPAAFEHRLDGQWTRSGSPVDAPKSMVSITAPIDIMAFPVSVAEYAACVADAACAPASGPVDRADLPVTGISYIDANAYAGWLSKKTGATWRLPTDAEWAQAAGSRFADDAIGVAEDPTNPAVRWLAEYDTETARAKGRNKTVRPIGTVNSNELGVHDIGGSVWEWTSTCLRRVDMDAAGTVTADNPLCGIYIVEGQHRAALTLFVRDPKNGGCSVGLPPDNLGFRLVRETGEAGFLDRVSGWLSS